MKAIDTFNQLRKGMRVRDTWYGNGIVVRMTKSTALIRLHNRGEMKYDKAHVNAFIKKGHCNAYS